MQELKNKSFVKYEYDVTYIEVEYNKDFLGDRNCDFTPFPESIWNNEDLHKQLGEMGNEGWELTTVQPLLRGEAYAEPVSMTIDEGFGMSSGGVGYGLSLTAGYYLFWKRCKP